MNNPLACCARFAAMLRDVDTGIGVIPFHDGERRVFKLVGRPFDRDVLKHFAINGPPVTLKGPRGAPIPFITAIYDPIRYCPMCGTDLQKVIDSNVELFDQAALLAAAQEESL